MKKNKISKNWINKQRRDTYVKQSKIDGYRARSAYKLIEIDEKFKVFKGGISIVDKGFRSLPTNPNNNPSFNIINKKPIIPTLKEIEINPPSRSAKLRAVKRQGVIKVATKFIFEKFKYLLEIENVVFR